MDKYAINRVKCWYEGTCKDVKEDCKLYCSYFGSMHKQFLKSNLPRNKWYRQHLTLEGYSEDFIEDITYIRDNIVKLANSGKNVLIHSRTPGTGKTEMAVRLLQEYAEQVRDYPIYDREDGIPHNTIAFIQATSFVRETKNFDNKDENIIKLSKRIQTSDLVVWDDIGVGNYTEYDLGTLYSIINQRIFNGLSNIFTTNLTQAEMINKLGSRLASRVWGTSITLDAGNIERRAF